MFHADDEAIRRALAEPEPASEEWAAAVDAMTPEDLVDLALGRSRSGLTRVVGPDKTDAPTD